jgi:hypothetical protein
MSPHAAHVPASGVSGGLTPHMALRIAWMFWLLFLVTPFFLFLHIVWILSSGPTAEPAQQMHGQHWFLVAMLYLLIMVPGSFFARGWVFKAYWTGKPVSPGKYLSGMMSIWLALEVGGLFALCGCVVNQSLLPNLLPALVAFMFFVTLWPSGRAMSRPMGQYEDPEVYEEPR